jgi:hypothetical protein
MSKYRKSLARAPSERGQGRGDKEGDVPTPRRIAAGHEHEFKVLMTPPQEMDDPYTSRPASPSGSDSSRRHILGKQAPAGYDGETNMRYADSYSTFAPMPYSSSQDGVGLGADGYRYSQGYESTTSLEPYGRSHGFGERDSVWDLHSRSEEASRYRADSVGSSRAASPSFESSGSGNGSDEAQRGRAGDLTPRRYSAPTPVPAPQHPHRPRSSSRLRDEVGRDGNEDGDEERDVGMVEPRRASLQPPPLPRRPGSDDGLLRPVARPGHGRALSE